MSAPKKQKPVERLLVQMERVAHAMGECQWTNGYRTGAVGVSSSEGERLYQREMGQWAALGKAKKSFRRLALRLLREAANTQTKKRGRNG